MREGGPTSHCRRDRVVGGLVQTFKISLPAALAVQSIRRSTPPASPRSASWVAEPLMWRHGVTSALADTAVDMTLRADNADPLTTDPQRQQQQTTLRNVTKQV